MPSERFENALRRVPQPIPPIWFMRQAGRYHSHYRALRERHSFMELCRNPELAAQVALGPILDFDFDVAILFSDLLFPLEALGMSLSYGDTGPVLSPKLDKAQLGELRTTEDALSRLEFQRDAVRATREIIPKHKSVIGFVGGPWTLFVYAMEGSHKGDLVRSKTAPDLYRAFADRLVPLLIENVRLQIEGGAEVVMVFDTAAGELSPAWFQREVAGDLAAMFHAFPGKLGYYARGIQPAHLPDLWFDDAKTISWGARSELGRSTTADPRSESAASITAGPRAETPVSIKPSRNPRRTGPWEGCAGIGVDWRWDLREALRLGSEFGFVQGNFDPALLFLPAREFRDELHAFLEPLLAIPAESRSGWVCGLGHGVLPRTPEENVATLVRTVREVFHAS